MLLLWKKLRKRPEYEETIEVVGREMVSFQKLQASASTWLFTLSSESRLDMLALNPPPP